MNISVRRTAPPKGRAVESPLAQFLTRHQAILAQEHGGAVANYIPELAKADPDLFGVALATMDGFVYAAGDADAAFTIQSISKAFVFALALDLLGGERVEAEIGVEPSGEAFNSIRLNARNRPFNPMVNAGAIACSGLIHEAEGGNAFEKIRSTLGQFAARELDVDESVHASETATGDRNRAIGYLLKNHSALKSDVDAVLDVYFRQCAILVTARDLAVMAATLANGGINPVTGKRVASPYSVSRTLSIMTSSGMYDYAGEWTYRVGIPAKSGVGGGIAAALPSQFGLGTFSPKLDTYGNSVRGLKMCEAISVHFDLHVLNRPGNVQTCVAADYGPGRLSRRGRQPSEQRLLDEKSEAIRVLELTGTLTFADVDYIARRIGDRAEFDFLILDCRRVPVVSLAAVKMLTGLLDEIAARGVKPIVSGIQQQSVTWSRLGDYLGGHSDVRHFAHLDDAVEWAEDQIVYRSGGYNHIGEPMHFAEQPLLAGLPADQVEALLKLGVKREFRPGDRIVTAGEQSASFFLLGSGMVSVKLPDGVRLASLVPGTAFGELALIGMPRSADVWADTGVTCLEIGLKPFDRFRKNHPESGEQIMRNLATLLAKRLGQANARIDALASH